MEEKQTLTRATHIRTVWRTTFLQGSWNYERMQNGGWVYAMIPAIKQLYHSKEDRAKALQRHLQFFNTHPYVASPIVGVTLALEEECANGKEVDDEEFQQVKVGMMGPLAGVADPVFWFTLRPLLGAIGASLAIEGSIVGPIFFFAAWNIIRYAFMWITQQIGYRMGRNIGDVLSDGLLHDVTKGASIIGVFMMGALVQRWVRLDLASFAVQQQLDALLPGIGGLLVTLGCIWLLRKKASPVLLIVVLFVIGIVGHAAGLL